MYTYYIKVAYNPDINSNEGRVFSQTSACWPITWFPAVSLASDVVSMNLNYDGDSFDVDDLNGLISEASTNIGVHEDVFKDLSYNYDFILAEPTDDTYIDIVNNALCPKKVTDDVTVLIHKNTQTVSSNYFVGQATVSSAVFTLNWADTDEPTADAREIALNTTYSVQAKSYNSTAGRYPQTATAALVDPTITYTVTNEDGTATTAATVSTTGEFTATAPGRYKVTATLPMTDEYTTAADEGTGYFTTISRIFTNTVETKTVNYADGNFSTNYFTTPYTLYLPVSKVFTTVPSGSTYTITKEDGTATADAAVSTDGKITFSKVGTFLVGCNDGTSTTYVELVVNKGTLTNLSWNCSNDSNKLTSPLNMTKDYEGQLMGVIVSEKNYNELTNKQVSYTVAPYGSEYPGEATVNESGYLIATKAGLVTITATISSDLYEDATLSRQVAVYPVPDIRDVTLIYNSNSTDQQTVPTEIDYPGIQAGEPSIPIYPDDAYGAHVSYHFVNSSDAQYLDIVPTTTGFPSLKPKSVNHDGSGNSIPTDVDMIAKFTYDNAIITSAPFTVTIRETRLHWEIEPKYMTVFAEYGIQAATDNASETQYIEFRFENNFNNKNSEFTGYAIVSPDLAKNGKATVKAPLPAIEEDGTNNLGKVRIWAELKDPYTMSEVLTSIYKDIYVFDLPSSNGQVVYVSDELEVETICYGDHPGYGPKGTDEDECEVYEAGSPHLSMSEDDLDEYSYFVSEEDGSIIAINESSVDGEFVKIPVTLTYANGKYRITHADYTQDVYDVVIAPIQTYVVTALTPSRISWTTGKEPQDMFVGGTKPVDAYVEEFHVEGNANNAFVDYDNPEILDQEDFDDPIYTYIVIDADFDPNDYTDIDPSIYTGLTLSQYTGKATVDASGNIVPTQEGKVRVVALTTLPSDPSTWGDYYPYKQSFVAKDINIYPVPTVNDLTLTYGDATGAEPTIENLPDGATVTYEIPTGDTHIHNKNTDGSGNIIPDAVTTDAIEVIAHITVDGETIDVPFNVTVDKATPVITWQRNPKSMTDAATQNIAVNSSDPYATASNVVLTDDYQIAYKIVNGTGSASISDAGVMSASQVGTVEVVAYLPETENYHAAEARVPVTIYIQPTSGDLSITYGSPFGQYSISRGTGEYALPANTSLSYSYVDPNDAAYISFSTGRYGCVSPIVVKPDANYDPVWMDVIVHFTYGDVITVDEQIKVIVRPRASEIVFPDKDEMYAGPDGESFAATVEYSYEEVPTVASDAIITYSLIDNATGAAPTWATIDANGKITATQGGELTIVANATFPVGSASDINLIDPEEATKVVTVHPLLIITVCENGKDGSGNPIITDPDDDDRIIEFGLFEAAGKTVVNTASYQANVMAMLTNLGVISANYNNVTYTVAAGEDAPATIAEVNDDGTINAYRLDATGNPYAYPLVITASVEDNPNLEDATCAISIRIPRGTMLFNQADGNWSEHTGWHRPDIIPLGINHNVEISKNCAVDIEEATCYDLNVASTGKMTVNSDAAVEVLNTLSNAGTVDNILIKADEDGSGSIWFKKGTPLATAELYCYGTKPEDGATPDWMYRGIPVAASLITMEGVSSTSYDAVSLPAIYEWSETPVDRGTFSENWNKVASGSINGWTGYSFAKITDDTPSGYTAIAKGTLNTGDHEFALASTGGDENHNKGNNLITNSFSAPMLLSSLAESDFVNANATVYFYNHASDYTYNQNLWGNNLYGTGAGQVIVWPIYSGADAYTSVNKTESDITMIPSGSSFFVHTDNASGATFTLRHAALQHNSASDKMLAPREKEEFNILEMYVEGGDMGDRLVLMESDHCSAKYDNGYDGIKMENKGNVPQLYASNDFGKTAVNVDEKIVGQYVGFKAAKNGVRYTISFNTDRLEGYNWLYLYDNKEKRYTDILKGETYNFTGTYSGEEKRFIIVGEREDGSKNTGYEHRIEVVGNQALISGFDGESELIFIVDMSGKMVWQDNTANGPWFEIPDGLPDGVYVIKSADCQTKFVK